MPEFQARPIMTPTEAGFFELLCASLPEFLVFPQVSMSAIVDTAQRRHRGFFSQKTIDFVICRRGDLSVVTVVELDDWSHDRRGHLDARRDAIVSSAGFRTVRIDCRRMPDGPEIRRLVLGATVSPHW
jgi:hypothetical protein